MKHFLLLALVFLACACSGTASRFVRPDGVPTDVLPEYNNVPVTALVEDSESVRMAVGAAWDDALACRALAGYLEPWGGTSSAYISTGMWAQIESDRIVARGARIYELVKCVDDGINSVRFARDTRDEPRLMEDVAFWRNELALAATQVLAYAKDAADLRAAIEQYLEAEAARRGIAARFIDGRPWANPEREAWRKAGPATGVRLPLHPHPGSLPDWWDKNLSVQPGYMATKLHSAGDLFFTPTVPVGAWGLSCTGPGTYDWAEFDRMLRLLADRRCKMLLELPTLQEFRTDEQIAADFEKLGRDWACSCPTGWPPSLPKYLAANAAASLVARNADGTLHPHGGVQLFNTETAAAYADYLKAMAAHLKQAGTYDAIAAIHLEQGDWAQLPEDVDYSDLTTARWGKFMAGRYGDVAALNKNAGTNYQSFDELQIPFRTVDPRAANDWAEFTAQSKDTSAKAWARFTQQKYKSKEGVRAALGDDYQDGYGARLPFIYQPTVIGIDYLHFRRVWVQEYLAIKRKLVQAAFPDKLVITEMRQFGDHDGVQGLGEKKWGGFLSDDMAQWTNVGPENANRPFMIRSVEPVGFGTRPSDSIESLFRDYLWLNFREPGNLARYFYHWVAHGYMDYQLGWHSLTNHWLTDRLIYDIGTTVANTAPEPQRIGLLLPRETYDLNDGPLYYSFLGWDWVLHAAKLPYTRIDEHFVRNGRLPGLGLELLIVPDAYAMDDTLAAEIATWVENGGTLIASTIPGLTDEYGRPRAEPVLAKVLGVLPAGTTSEAVKGTPLTITVPHGHYSGKWQETTDRKPDFEVLQATTAKVLASYESDKGGQESAAITINQHGKGRAVTIGYPFGTEAVECERTSIGFYRTYVWFVREPQLVARTKWLREFIVNQLGYRPDFAVDYAEVQRFKGVEEIGPGLHMPAGLSQDPKSPFFIRTVGDPRPDHQMLVSREEIDLAIRFFPRRRDGVNTKYLGISTREVHYLGPRATIEMILARHTYRCRINDPKIQAIWDVARNAPVGFERDATGVSFTVSLPSGHIMMLATSETPAIELFRPAPFPGRDKADVLARCVKLSGGKKPSRVLILTPDIKQWAHELATPPDPKQPDKRETVLISYGQPGNKQAAETLAKFLGQQFGLDVQTTEQAARLPAKMGDQLGNEWQQPLILIGNEWTNNDMAMHGAYWGTAYGAHLPFTTTYAWPGDGRAVVSLSRRYALTNNDGRIPFQAQLDISIRPVERRWPLLRRKLHIAANGNDAERAVDEVITLLRKD
ncbi:MAG TPA: beta-galactosidase trimerization domain-containing protein [Planctomycetota bacterium]|nr:beta-galactosidase trimerization domain-containing protein [Planctomycetota bacterium]